ncbi:hypothetical protein SLEP1_g30033 [Rubroshorea leprosula]|uniref:GH10 domain-containing protein n=1 Tax=Rubroshorea leprosula TaxID=152421 RepID=A0AAV5K559_9ROSI|nr:hypothetical protein SLEP1_g30033 [Rubroshorea leprosula]
MKIAEIFILVLSSILLFSGCCINGVSYDYSATTKCLVEPERAHYRGGLIVNPAFNYGTEGWSPFGGAVIQEGISETGNRFVMVENRTNSLDSLSQKVQLEKGNLYSFSAWIQISKGSENESEIVSVMFKTSEGTLIPGGEVVAKQGCWSLLKGGIVANFSSPVEILLECRNTRVDIWADSLSMQPFTPEQWRTHQEESINKVRKSRVSLQLTYANETALDGAIVSIKQTKPGFPFGCGINHKILNSTGYQDWFTSRFRFTSFTNEMKWYSTEKKQGEENYVVADAMVEFAQQNGIFIRGHNILWDNPKMQPDWVKDLPPDELRDATIQRVNSVVSRYAGQLIGWDVVNENLHFRFFEDNLGENASAVFYSMTYSLDPDTILFMNEYNTIEDSTDQDSSAVRYKKKLEEILGFPGNENVKAGIGLQGHFGSGQPNIAYMRCELDILGTMGLPIWLTEVDLHKSPDQAKYLEEILREGFSHPAVEGIIIFGGPEVSGFYNMTLAGEDFINTEVGDVVDKLIDEWTSGDLEIAGDDEGFSEVLLFHGDYVATVNHPRTNSSTTVNFTVTKDTTGRSILVQIDA